MCKVTCLLAEQYPVCHLAAFAANVAVGQSSLGHWYLMRIIYIKWSEISWFKKWKTCWFLKAGLFKIKSSMFYNQILPFCLFEVIMFFSFHSQIGNKSWGKENIYWFSWTYTLRTFNHPSIQIPPLRSTTSIVCVQFEIHLALLSSKMVSVWAKKSSRYIHVFCKYPTLCWWHPNFYLEPWHHS